MSTIIATDRSPLHLGPGAVRRVDMDWHNPSGLMSWAGIASDLGTVSLVNAHLCPNLRNRLHEIALAILEGCCAPSMLWVEKDGKYEGTLIRLAPDGLIRRSEIRGTVNLGLIGGAR